MLKLYNSKKTIVSDAMTSEIKRPSSQTINFIRQLASSYHYSRELASVKTLIAN